jgi:DNA uptake protein ComE-like DNA-binding protein
MINYITKYFTLNRRERNGLMLLATLVLTLLLVKYLIIYQYKTTTAPVVVVELDSVAAKLAVNDLFAPGKHVSNGKTETAETNFFYFDPNTITEEQAQQLGFSPKLAHTLINYRNKGGKFRKAEDIKKLYGLRPDLYEKLASYILIGKPGEEKKPELAGNSATAKTKQEEKPVLEINSADSLQWLKLKGIGPGYTHRILKYKSLLGGFIAVSQLKEVYDFSDSLYNSIKDNLRVDASLIHKISVNTVDFKTMVHHPYIKYEGTKCIFALKKNKKIKAEDLVNSSCFSREMLEKVLPYLDFE